MSDKNSKTISLKQLKNMLNESIEDKRQYGIDYIECIMTKDDYNDGEDPSSSESYTVDAPNKKFASIEEALKYVTANYIFKPWNKGNWFYFEDGRFYTDFLVDESEQTPSSTDIEEWKQGRRVLYNQRYDVRITICTGVSLEDATKEGFEE
jgi:hypothetical protein